MKSKLNGSAKWVIVALSLLAVVFNSGVLYNDVAHLNKEVTLMRQEIKEIRNMIILGCIPQEVGYAQENDPTRND